MPRAPGGRRSFACGLLNCKQGATREVCFATDHLHGSHMSSHSCPGWTSIHHLIPAVGNLDTRHVMSRYYLGIVGILRRIATTIEMIKQQCC